MRLRSNEALASTQAFFETRASKFANTYETSEATNYLKNAKISKKWIN